MIHYTSVNSGQPLCGKDSHETSIFPHNASCPDCLKLLGQINARMAAAHPLENIERFHPWLITQQLTTKSPTVYMMFKQWENGRFATWEEFLIATIFAQEEVISSYQKELAKFVTGAKWVQGRATDVAPKRTSKGEATND